MLQTGGCWRKRGWHLLVASTWENVLSFTLCGRVLLPWLYSDRDIGGAVMRPKLLFLALLILSSFTAQGQHQFNLLHAFGGGKDGAGVWDSVAFDSRGNAYGTTSGGGDYGHGIVFQLRLTSKGKWSETVIHSFPDSPEDGQGPLGGVVFGADGTFYGTTEGGGGGYEYGTVYEMARTPQGWKETVLHRFGRRDQAGSPWGNLVMDEQRNLFGAAYAAFELSPGPKGWTESILHVFNGDNGDGLGAVAGPIRDTAGNLYGTTMYGGGGPICADGCGTVWELEPSANDDASGGKAWKEVILHRFGFSADDGAFPSLGQLAMDGDGNTYGAAGGGKLPYGVVFRLARVTDGSSVKWRETILYNFTGGADGNGPGGGVILDNAGNLYGTTIAGGNGNGVVFELSPQTDGSWQYTLLHTFDGSDGSQPDANLTLGPDGKLYGTTATGGANGGGVVFQLTP